MDLNELWETINENADWFLIAIISLVVLNLLALGWFVLTWMQTPDVHKKYEIKPSDQYVDTLERLENREDPEVDPPESDTPGSPPPKFTQFQKSHVAYTSFAMRQSDDGDILRPDTSVAPRPDPDKKPEITGFSVTGKIRSGGGGVSSSRGGQVVAIVNRGQQGEFQPYGGQTSDTGATITQVIVRSEEENRTYVVEEGDRVGKTDYLVKEINNRAIILDHPDYKETEFPFSTGAIKNRLEEAQRSEG